MMLARSGIGHLILVDFDKVDPSNLNRQHYMVSHLGMKKQMPLKPRFYRPTPLSVWIHGIHTSPRKTHRIFFSGCDLVCEAFDKAENKAELINSLLTRCPEMTLISGSGMAGYASSNTIRTQRFFRRLYLCGDQISGIEAGDSLMAPRVQICAAHEANMALRLLLGIEEV